MNPERVCQVLLEIGARVRERVHRSLLEQSHEERAAVHLESADDTIYQIDRDVEEILCPALSDIAEGVGGIVLIAEGIEEESGYTVFPDGLSEESASLRIIIDPIDGTRGIMYDKRSAFFLAAAAPNKGAETSLQDIEAAVMVELPTSRSHLSDEFWAVRGGGTQRRTANLLTNEVMPRPVTPTKSPTIYGGFAQISRFFPPGREVLAAIEEEMIETLFPEAPKGRAILFEDQYICTGGQLNELLVGHDRFVADLRTGLYRRFEREGRHVGMTAHPYDLCTALIGTEAGIVITGIDGEPLNAPLSTTGNVDWIGYANRQIQAEVEPVLHNLLIKYQLL